MENTSDKNNVDIKRNYPDQWFLLREEEKKTEPLSIDQIRNLLIDSDTRENVKIRNVQESEWIVLSEAGAIYPVLVDSGIVTMPNNPEAVYKAYEKRKNKRGQPKQKTIDSSEIGFGIGCLGISALFIVGGILMGTKWGLPGFVCLIPIAIGVSGIITFIKDLTKK